MKKLLLTLSLLSAFTANASELQLHDCKFDFTTTEFTPSAALTSILNKEVKGAVVYKVKYKTGSVQVGPKTDLAVVDQLSSKNLVISFFDLDQEDGVVYTNNTISIDLASPLSVDAPVINFAADLNDEDATEGSCNLSF